MAKIRKIRPRIYADTSVFGGVFDDEFDRASKIFFDEVKARKFVLITSELVREEILAAPKKVQDFFEKILPSCEIADIDVDVLELQEAYLKQEILSEKYSTDALHVALATVAGANMIISWNFKHIVHFQKIPLYNAVNQLKGYKPIDIYSPLEVIEDENEDI
jgi:predicted nucleic acid-binding protein